jgi:hypothetical protein
MVDLGEVGGKRSGVNWMRLNFASRLRASALIARVFERPGGRSTDKQVGVGEETDQQSLDHCRLPDDRLGHSGA